MNKIGQFVICKLWDCTLPICGSIADIPAITPGPLLAQGRLHEMDLNPDCFVNAVALLAITH